MPSLCKRVPKHGRETLVKATCACIRSVDQAIIMACNNRKTKRNVSQKAQLICYSKIPIADIYFQIS